MKWRHWRDDCERRLEEGEFNTNLEKVARVCVETISCLSFERQFAKEIYFDLIVFVLFYCFEFLIVIIKY